MNKLIDAVREMLQNYHIIPKATGRPCCVDCGCALHKRDRYTIVAIKHMNCSDTKLVGQTSLPSEGQIDG